MNYPMQCKILIGQKMTNKYDSYESELFCYEYPFKWDRRNKNYLKKRYDRKLVKEYIEPIVFRLRFYSADNDLLSDEVYSPNKNRIKFPVPEQIEDKTFSGWEFSYGDKTVIISQEDYTELKTAVMNGYDDIVLAAVYQDN